MSFELSSITMNATPKPPRIVLVGQEKIGKTTFACGCEFDGERLVRAGLNKPIVISIKGEEGVNDLEVPKFPTANSYEDVLSAMRTLYKGGHEFKTVVLDSASALEPLIWDAVCKAANVDSIEKVGGGYGKGYTEALEYWRKITGALDSLQAKGMASIIIGHARIKRIENPVTDTYDAFLLDANEKAGNLLSRWADVIMFAGSKVTLKRENTGFGEEKKRAIEGDGGKRYLFCRKNPAYPSGGRGIYGRLPSEIPLTWLEFQNAVAAISTTPHHNEENNE